MLPGICCRVCVLSLAVAVAGFAQEVPVTVTQDATHYILSNGILTAKINRQSGDLNSLVYKGIETMGVGGHAGGYWSHDTSRGARSEAITIDPKTNDGQRAEIAIKGVSGGNLMGSGPGGSTIADIEIRYALERGASGLYTYSIFHHKADYPATSVGEARFCAKLNDGVFDWMTVDANRNMEAITAYDWNHGTVMNMKEARLMTSGRYKGQVEHKYDYTAVQFEIPAWGWSSTRQRVGLWFVNPTIEYLSGGPTKLELCAHRDATFGTDPNAPAPPCLLNYWRGSHYGSTSLSVADREAWTKVIGPFMIYCNAGGDANALWKDALATAAQEAQKWPYPWVQGVDYPHKEQRGAVSGQLLLKDLPGARMSRLLVGLAHPDYPEAGGRGRVVDWQYDAKYYQFWVRGDEQGRFTIPNIRPGVYTLHAIADGVLGEYAKTEITVEPGKTLDLGQLIWTPVRYGRQLWDIGIPDRTAGEFLHGDHYWQWGLYNRYPKDFPNDVNFIIGKSDYRKDWNLMQVPRAHDDTGAGQGDAATWSVTFNLADAPRGKATLRLGIAGAELRSLALTMNDQPVGTVTGLINNSAIHRDSIRGYWQERTVPFDASLMKSGVNVLKLTVPAGPVASGIVYDYLRLELNENDRP